MTHRVEQMEEEIMGSPEKAAKVFGEISQEGFTGLLDGELMRFGLKCGQKSTGGTDAMMYNLVRHEHNDAGSVTFLLQGITITVVVENKDNGNSNSVQDTIICHEQISVQELAQKVMKLINKAYPETTGSAALGESNYYGFVNTREAHEPNDPLMDSPHYRQVSEIIEVLDDLAVGANAVLAGLIKRIKQEFIHFREEHNELMSKELNEGDVGILKEGLLKISKGHVLALIEILETGSGWNVQERYGSSAFLMEKLLNLCGLKLIISDYIDDHTRYEIFNMFRGKIKVG